MTINEISILVKRCQKQDAGIHVFAGFDAGRDPEDFSVWLKHDNGDVTSKFSVQRLSIDEAYETLVRMLKDG